MRLLIVNIATVFVGGEETETRENEKEMKTKKNKEKRNA